MKGYLIYIFELCFVIKSFDEYLVKFYKIYCIDKIGNKWVFMI